MSSKHLGFGLISFGLFFASHVAIANASDDGSAGSTAVSSAQVAAPPPTVLPSQGTASGGNDHKRPFTITATLREEYDSNIFTATTGEQSSLKTIVSPSILVDVPMEDTDLSARYTFGLTYYSNRAGGSLDLSHNFVAQFRHSFSERFSLSLAEQFTYSTEPSLFDSSTTLYRNGAYYQNTINAEFDGQWTPLFSTTTTYSNALLRYEDGTQSTEQNSDENTGSQNFAFALQPKINLVFGAIIDDLSYDYISRGYTSYTGNFGVDWQALPSLSLGARVGGSITDTVGSGGSTTSPYAAASVHWQLGSRSAFAFNYVHEVVPTDVITADGQIADRFTASLHYDILPTLTVHGALAFTHGDYTDGLIVPGAVSNYTENDLALETGLDYHVNSYLDLEAGYIFSDVSSDLSFRDYTRHQIYIGVRGTY